MLGKGLESLIPQKGPSGGSTPAGGQSTQPTPASQPEPASKPEMRWEASHAHLPASIPASAPDDLPVAEETFLPGPQDENLLRPILEEEKELPAGKPVKEESVTIAPEKTYSAQKPIFEKPSGHKERQEAIFYLDTAKIKANTNQPRKFFDEEAIQDLANSIREFGVLQPIVVTKKEREVPTGTEVEYELIAGERRLRAAKSLGLERIPAIIRHIDLERERLELAIIENLQRENLNGIEMARSFSQLQDEFRLTQREIAARLGKSRETVANTLRLLDLPTYIQDAIQKHEISESHGLFLLGVDDPGLQQTLFRDLIDKKLTIRELRARARALGPRKERASLPGMEPEIKMFEERLASELGAPVSIQQKGESGKITIDFYSKEELDALIQRLSATDE